MSRQSLAMKPSPEPKPGILTIAPYVGGKSKIEGVAEPIIVTPTELQPREMFLRGLRASARLIPTHNGLRIGYVHVWSYAGDAYQGCCQVGLGLTDVAAYPA